jgi:hypothetical protein
LLGEARLCVAEALRERHELRADGSLLRLGAPR